MKPRDKRMQSPLYLSHSSWACGCGLHVKLVEGMMLSSCTKQIHFMANIRRKERMMGGGKEESGEKRILSIVPLH